LTKKEKNDDDKTLVVGVGYTASYPILFKQAIHKELEKKGYNVTIKPVNDSYMLIEALLKGEIDTYLTGHQAAMEFMEKGRKIDLEFLITVPSTVYGIHTKTLKARNLEEFKQALKPDDVIGIPHDPSNLSRGLIMLENIGILKLKDNIDKYYATEKDIAENPYGIQLRLLESTQCVRVLESVAAALVFGTDALTSNNTESRIIKEYIDDERFLVGFVVKPGRENEQWAKDIIDVLHSEEFKNVVEDPQYIFIDFQRPEWYVKKWDIRNELTY
jgi:D-methionine transport system substrate-binding protein